MKEVRKLITDLAFNYYEHGSRLDTIIPEADIDPIIKYIGDNFVSRVELPVKPEIAGEKYCDVLGCNEKVSKNIRFCKPHNIGMIGCAVVMSIALLCFIVYLITKI